MVEVGRDIKATIDYLLAYLEAEWQDILDLEREWPDLPEWERLDFVLEWPLKESRLQQLRDFARQGRLTAEQSVRYEQLQRLLTQNRLALEHLLAD